MEWQDKLKQYFKEMNILEENQFKVYFELLTRKDNKPTKASKLTERTGLNRSYIYNVLKILEEKGLITVLGGSPTKYIANSPLNFVETHITSKNLELNELIGFKTFINTEVQPELNKFLKLASVPLKEVYMLGSFDTFEARVINLLQNCKMWLFMKTTNKFLVKIQEPLIQAITMLEGASKPPSGGLAMLRIAFIADNSQRLPEKIKRYVIVSNQPITIHQLVVDNALFLLNIRPEDKTIGQGFFPQGIGILIRDKEIAASYGEQIISSIKSFLYSSKGKSTIDDLTTDMKSDERFKNGMAILFNKGWRISNFESRLSENYLQLFTPDHASIIPMNEAYIWYRPQKKPITEEKLDQTYKYVKKVILKHFKLLEDAKVLTIESEDAEEVIEGVDCKLLINYIRLDTRYSEEEKNKPQSTDKPFIERHIVFNYHNRAILVAFAVNPGNLIEILKAL